MTQFLPQTVNFLKICKIALAKSQGYDHPRHGFALNTHHTLCKTPSFKMWRWVGLAIWDDSLMMVFVSSLDGTTFPRHQIIKSL